MEWAPPNSLNQFFDLFRLHGSIDNVHDLLRCYERFVGRVEEASNAVRGDSPAPRLGHRAIWSSGDLNSPESPLDRHRMRKRQADSPQFQQALPDSLLRHPDA